MMRLRIVLLLLICAGAATAKAYLAQRYDVRLRLLPDTSLQVTETVRFEFLAEPFSFVSREISKRGCDRISGVRTEMDGAPARTGIDEDARRVRVVWHFDAAAGSTHEFTLEYRVEGALFKRPDTDALRWNVIPEHHSYTILAGQVDFDYPERSLLGRPALPVALSATHTADRSTFTLPVLKEDRGAQLRADFVSGFAAKAPDWQIEQAAAHDRASQSWMIGAAVAVAGIVLGILAWFSLAGPLRRKPEIPEAIATARTDLNFPPAVAAGLAAPVSGSQAALGTFFDLAREGVIVIRPTVRKSFGKTCYEVEPGQARSMLPFEASIVKAVLGEPPARNPQDFSACLTKISGVAREFNEVLETHMLSLGLLDPERIRKKKEWRNQAIVLMVGGLVSLAGGMYLAFEATGNGQGLAAGASLVGLGAAACLVGIGLVVRLSYVSTLSRLGAERAAAPYAMRGTISAMVDGKREAAAGDFDRWLPFAMATGLGAGWIRRFRSESEALPAWLAAGNGANGGMDFFDSALIAASGSDSSGSDGGGSSGGSGGGSSDAG